MCRWLLKSQQLSSITGLAGTNCPPHPSTSPWPTTETATVLCPLRRQVLRCTVRPTEAVSTNTASSKLTTRRNSEGLCISSTKIRPTGCAPGPYEPTDLSRNERLKRGEWSTRNVLPQWQKDSGAGSATSRRHIQPFKKAHRNAIGRPFYFVVGNGKSWLNSEGRPVHLPIPLGLSSRGMCP